MRHGGDWWTCYCRRGRSQDTWRRLVESLLQERKNQGDMEEIGGLVSAGEREKGRTKETFRRLVDSSCGRESV